VAKEKIAEYFFVEKTHFFKFFSIWFSESNENHQIKKYWAGLN
jgi:hypothetical protein